MWPACGALAGLGGVSTRVTFVAATRPTVPAQYCWGGRFVLLLGGSGKPEVRAVAPIHMAGVTLPKDVVALRVPAWFGFGAKDMISPTEVATRAALRGAPADVQAACELVSYPGCAHGYAIRGDMGDATVEAARADTVARTAAFFEKHV